MSKRVCLAGFTMSGAGDGECELDCDREDGHDGPHWDSRGISWQQDNAEPADLAWPRQG